MLFVSDVCFLLVIGIKMIREYINFQIANIEIIEIHGDIIYDLITDGMLVKSKKG